MQASFHQDKLIPFDAVPCTGFSLEDDLEEGIWLRFKECAGIPADMAPHTALRDLKLLTEDGWMTQAGAWLLARDIRDFHRHAHVSCTLFQGMGKTTVLAARTFTATSIR